MVVVYSRYLQICQDIGCLMPPKKSRLAMLIAERQRSLGLIERAVAEKYGWVQQTYSTWKRGTIPRPDVRDALADFLDMPRAELDSLCSEAQERAAPGIGVFDTAQPHGKVSDRKDGKFKFDQIQHGYGVSYIPRGRYAVRVETNVMEPALLYGARVWADPAAWPRPGNDVFVHGAKGAAWIGRLEAIDGQTARLSQYGRPGGVVVENFEAIHVVVLAERVVAA